LRIWRLASRKYVDTAFSGIGSYRVGGRWSSPGMYAVYTSRRLSLCVLEQLVHMEVSHMGAMFASIPMDIPGGTLIEAIQTNEDPSDIDDDIVVQTRGRITTRDWKDVPSPATNRGFGDDWLKDSKSAILRVPSAIVPSESNFLLNVEHPDFKNFNIGDAEDFFFDSRL